MPDLPAYPGTPRWVKIVGAVSLVLLLVLGFLLVTGVGGEHSPSRHLPFGGAGGSLPSAPDVAGRAAASDPDAVGMPSTLGLLQS